MLSAIGWPLAPTATVRPLATAAGDYVRMGEHPTAQVVMPDVLPHAVEPGDPSYAQAAAGDQFIGSVPMLDSQARGGPASTFSLLSAATPEAVVRLAEPDAVVAVQDPSDTSVVIAVRTSPLQLDMTITTGSIYQENTGNTYPETTAAPITNGSVYPETTGSVYPGSSAHNAGMAGYDSPQPRDLAAPATVEELRPLDYRISNGVPSLVGTPELPPTGSPPPTDTAPLNHEPGDSRGPQDLVVESSFWIVDFTVVDPAVPVARSHSSDTPAIGDASRIAGQASAAVESPLPALDSTANPPAATAPWLDAAAGNSTDSGSITLTDDAVATASSLGNSPASNSSTYVARDAELDQGSWLADILPNPRAPADARNGSDATTRSRGSLASESTSRLLPQALGQPVADEEEGGSIDLAFTLPSLDPSDNGSSLAMGSTASNGSQQLSEIRPECGVELFCDIEVATAPILPDKGSLSATIPERNAGASEGSADGVGSKTNAVAKPVPPLSKVSYVTLPGLSEDLPLLLCAAVLVSQGGLRLEEKVSERDRRLRCLEDLRGPSSR